MKEESKGILIKDLKENTLYRCRLSGRMVLVIHNQPAQWHGVLGEKIEGYEISCIAYNSNNSMYDSVEVFDNMLENI